MNRNTRLLVLLFVSVVMLSVFPARGHAFVGSMLRSVSREVAEICGRKGVQEGAEELGRVCLEKGGKVIKGCGRAGIRAVELAGDDAVRVAARYGREGVEMLARHSADEARFLARHADDAVAVWRRFGNEGTRLLVKHPGLARPLLENCGRRGLQVIQRPALILAPCDAVAKGSGRFNKNFDVGQFMLYSLELGYGSSELVSILSVSDAFVQDIRHSSDKRG